MADFCKECSIDMFGKDYGDLAYLGGAAPTLAPDYGYAVICEGCGFIRVNDEGICLEKDCLLKHNT